MTKHADKKADRADAGREFITALVASFPEGDLRTTLTGMLTDDVLADETLAGAVAFAGDGVLRKSEFSRTMDETRTVLKTQTDANAVQKGRLDDWYATNQSKLASFDDMAAQVATLQAAAAAAPAAGEQDLLQPAPLPEGFDPAQFVRVSDLEQRDLKQQQDFLGFHRISQRIGLQHFADFKEVFDEEQVLRHPNIQTIGFEAAYQDLFKDQIATRQTALETKASETLEADLRKKWEAEQQSAAARPYPLGMEASDLGTLARLQEEQKTTQTGGSAAVETATRGYLERLAGSQEGPPA
jgi:hypothetical protein